MKSDGVQETSSRARESAMVTMYSVGPTKASRRLSLLTVRASGARSEPPATTLPSQVQREINKPYVACDCLHLLNVKSDELRITLLSF